MASILDTITSQLGGDTLRQISRQIGADEQKTEAATGATVSTLLAALAKNSSGNDGAESLHRALAKDHDGSVLDNLQGLIDRPESGSGMGILRHVLGNKESVVQAGVASSSGINQDSAGKLMQMLAPIVMGALGKQQRQSGMDSSSLAGLLGGERQAIERKQPQAAGIFGQLLDTDHDGDVDMGDLAKHGAGLLGKLFKG